MGSEYSVLHNTMAERLTVVAEASDSLGQFTAASEYSILHNTMTEEPAVSCSLGFGQFRTEFTAASEYSILHKTMTEEPAVSCSLGFGQFMTEFTAGSEYSILHNTVTARLALVAEVLDRLGQSLQADDVELNVLGCQVDILGTNCDQCLMLLYVRRNHKAH